MTDNYESMLSNARLEDESFEDYKLRLKNNYYRLKLYLQGQFLHKSKKFNHLGKGFENKGITYNKPKGE